MPTPVPTVVTWGQFISAFAEFENVPRARIERFLVMAEASVSAATWDAKRADGVRYLAAHLLAINPIGESARLESSEAKTTYGQHFEFLKSTVAYGFRVL